MYTLDIIYREKSIHIRNDKKSKRVQTQSTCVSKRFTLCNWNR